MKKEDYDLYTYRAGTILFYTNKDNAHAFSCGKSFESWEDKKDVPKSVTGVPDHKYDRTVTNKYGESIVVDVYDVLVGFDIKCPAVQHSLKKSLCTGLRGVKGYVQDIDESIESLQRAKELYKSKSSH